MHIHAEGPAFFAWLPKMFGKRVVVTVHGIDWQREKWQSGLGSKFIHQGEKNAANVIMMVPFSVVVLWTFGEKIGNSLKKILWKSGKITFVFSVSIEMLQLLLRLGTFQLSDIFYNTVGGVLGGVCYSGIKKAIKKM